MVLGGRFEDFPVFELGDAVFGSGSEGGDRGIECFLPLLPGCGVFVWLV